MKKLILTTIFVTIHLVIFAQVDCPTKSTIFLSQSEVDSFKILYPNCTEFKALTLKGSDIMNVNNLPAKISIDGPLVIENCSNLKEFNIDVVVNTKNSFIKIINNPILTTIKGLNSVIETQNIDINNNPLLTDSDYCGDMIKCGNINFYQNNSVVKINGFNNLVTGKVIEIFRNNSLEEINGFNAAKSITELKVYRNDKLVKFDGFNNYGDYTNRVHFDSRELVYFKGFQNLKSCGTILFSNVMLEKIESFYDVEASSVLLLRCEKLKDVQNFKRLKRAGVINVGDSRVLKDLSGFDSVKVMTGQLYLDINSGFESINSFNQLDSVYDLIYLYKNQYNEINGFKNLKYVKRLYLTSNYKLKTINGFHNLNKAEEVSVYGNPIQNLNAFYNLEFCDSLSIRSNFSLINLNELVKLDVDYLKKLEISHDTSLSICNTPPICDYVKDSLKYAIIIGNATGCATREEIIESCRVSSADYINKVNSIYPNPVQEILNVSEHFDYGYIFDISGREIMGVYSTRIDCTNLAPGVYFLKTIDGDFQSVSKFIKL